MSPRHSANNTKTDLAPQCRQTRARLLAFLDGELDGRAHQDIQRHLETCAACRQEWEWQRRAEQALSAAHQSVPDPGDMRSAFYTRLAATENRRRLNLMDLVRRATLPAALALPALAVAVVVGTRLHHPAPQNTRQQLETNVIAHAPELAVAPVRVPIADSSVQFELSHRHRNRLSPSLRIAANTGAEWLSRGIHGNAGRRRKHGEHPIQLALAKPEDRVNQQIEDHSYRYLAPYSGANRLSNQYAQRDSSNKPQDALMARLYAKPAIMDAPVKAAVPKPVAALMDSAAPTRAELMNEEVSVHLVNDKNEEVGGADVTPPTGAGDPAVIHVEADAPPTATEGSTRR